MVPCCPAQFFGHGFLVHKQISQWFRQKKWKPFSFQLELLDVWNRAGTGLLHAPTGMGKTVAVLLPVCENALNRTADPDQAGLKLLWITPLRALASDTALAIEDLLHGVGLNWKVECRTGDSSSSVKARQRKKLPEVLVTTPESLSLLLSYPETRGHFSGLAAVVVDEWHELLSSKRGVQTELGLARLRNWLPDLKVWGLSATLANMDEALAVLHGAQSNSAKPTAIIRGNHQRDIEIQSIIPDSMESFPWAGHLGLALLDKVLNVLEKASTSLVFTNTRSQAEMWYQAIVDARPGWADTTAVHHGSIDRAERDKVESDLKQGTVRVVVCTSSLDLGVDFVPVEQVIQIGGPKGIARLLQRAGRSGHQPGKVSRIWCVPANALELVEYAAVRESLRHGRIEPRTPLEKPFDLLVQHIVTVCLGEPMQADRIFDEVRSAWAYRNLTREEFQWALDFLMFGGKSLKAYQEFARIIEVDGLLSTRDEKIGKFHRMTIGTITSDTAVVIRFKSGRSLGSVEESFISRIKTGQVFAFAGRHLKLEKFHNNIAYVTPSRSRKPDIPAWGGGKSPLSSLLADAVLEQLGNFEMGIHADSPELQAVRPILETQSRVSKIPGQQVFLIEVTRIRSDYSWFFYSFGGRLAHEGLAALVAWKITSEFRTTVTTSVNDYGFHLSTPHTLPMTSEFWRGMIEFSDLPSALLECLNASEMARRQFREIARVAGLIFSGYPGARKTGRQLQVSSQLLFQVFSQYEPDHLLLDQARREVLQQQLEINRIHHLLQHLQNQSLHILATEKLSPLAFPLWTEMIRSEVSSESWTDRVNRMAQELNESSGSRS